MNQEKIGRFISCLRREKGLTQEELGEILGVSSRSVSKWENGKCMPDLSLFRPLCDEFNISINELFEGSKINNIKNKISFDNILLIMGILSMSIGKVLNNTILILFSSVLVCISFRKYFNKLLLSVKRIISKIKNNNYIFGILLLSISFVTIFMEMFYLNNVLLQIIGILSIMYGIYSLIKDASNGRKIFITILVITLFLIIFSMLVYIMHINSIKHI